MANADRMALEKGATTATFEFKLDNVVVGRFQEVSGLEVTIESEEVVEGGQNGYKHTLPGRISWPNIVLKRTVTNNSALLKWVTECAVTGSEIPRKHGAIDLLDREGTTLASWAFDGAIVVRWTGPQFNVASDDVLLEEVEIAHNGFAVPK